MLPGIFCCRIVVEQRDRGVFVMRNRAVAGEEMIGRNMDQLRIVIATPLRQVS